MHRATVPREDPLELPDKQKECPRTKEADG
jgi:hypothetical protein